MEVIWQTDADEIDLLVGDEIIGRGEFLRRASGLQQLLATRGNQVRDGDDFITAGIRVTLGMCSARPPAADDANS